MSSDGNAVWLGGWSSDGSCKFQVPSKLVTELWGSEIAHSRCIGRWLIHHLVLLASFIHCAPKKGDTKLIVVSLLILTNISNFFSVSDSPVNLQQTTY